MKALRWLIGRIILFLNWAFSPSPVKRSEAEQNKVDEEAKKLSLYEFEACPFCVKVRRQMKRLNLDIERRDAMNNPEHRSALLRARGKVKVPCLRIEKSDGSVEWMPESSDINAYLASRFSPKAA